jgi:hypothetical protein
MFVLSLTEQHNLRLHALVKQLRYMLFIFTQYLFDTLEMKRINKTSNTNYFSLNQKLKSTTIRRVRV